MDRTERRKREIRFVHGADLHLGRGLSIPSYDKAGKETQEFLKNAVQDSFSRMIRFAIEKKVDFVLLSGDIFDLNNRSIQDYHLFLEGMKKLEKENIKVYMISGNHDPKGNWKSFFSLPSNVTHFSAMQMDEAEYRDEEGNLLAKIYGRSYEKQADKRKWDLKIEKEDCFQICLLHTMLDKNTPQYMPITLEDLKAYPEIDYFALGHIHQCRILREEKPAVAFSGTILPRDIMEQEKGSMLYGELSPYQKPILQKVVLSDLFWKQVEVALPKEVENFTELESYLEEQKETLLEDIFSSAEGEEAGFAIIRWVLTGKTPLASLLSGKETEGEEELFQIFERVFEEENDRLLTHSVLFPLHPVTEEERPIDPTLLAELDRIFEGWQEGNGKKELEKVMGDLWSFTEDPEKEEEEKLLMEKEEFAFILEKAKELIISRYGEEER